MSPKRITMKLKNPNPLFVKWLTEWRDKAKNENSKMEYCFTTALRSLKQYPLPFERGRDCKILKGFGNKLCQMLDNKLKQHEMDAGNNSDDGVVDFQASDNASKTPTKKRKSNSPTEVDPPKSKRYSKEYLPQVGTGGYAILITLYTQSLDPTYPGFLSKQDIITEGQNLSRTSFTKPDPGSRYTAWSSMKILITKNLVIKKDCPAKFSLTEEGLAVARKLLDKGSDSDSSDNNFSPPFGKSNHKDINGIARKLLDKGSDSNSSNNFSPPFENSNHNKDINGKAFDLDLSYDERPCSSKYNSFENFKMSSESGHSSSSRQNVRATKFNAKNIEPGSSGSPASSVISLGSEEIFVAKELNCKSKTIQKHTSTSSVTAAFSEVRLNVKTKSRPIEKHALSSSGISSQSSTQEECFILPPNTFDIILYIDTAETSGSSALIQDDPILAELVHLQVRYEVKHLKIGDYIWICRDKTSEKELVLPYIVERKRMDDFGKSIKDGRYHEQKFRLKKSGIQNITYLVEKYGNSQYMGLPITTLYQAATNTAIQDGFCVKFTENIRDTARHLANFSSILIKMFQSKTLVSCPKENLSEISLEDDLISIMTFKEFNQTSLKNKPMKVSDLFVKMLLQINGMSVDRALAIVEAYPTPAVLKKAYVDKPGLEGEKLLASIQFGDCNKNIGLVLSKIIHQLFTLPSFS